MYTAKHYEILLLTCQLVAPPPVQYGLVPQCTWSDIPMRSNDVTTTYYSLLVSYHLPL